jgi:acetyl esterase
VALHPQVEALRRERLATDWEPLHRLTVEEARRREQPAPSTGGVALARVFDTELGAVPARIYLPVGLEEPAPVLVYFFGGGWVLGSIDAIDPVCRRLAAATPCAVVSVGYRRAPEHRFPAAVEDCEAALRAVAARAGELGFDPRRIAVGGASAGANLAAVVAQLCRDLGLAFQLLVYPVTDYQADTPSMRANVDPCFLNPSDVDWCWSHYLRDERDGRDPRAAPLRAADLDGLPPALVVTAEADPLRDEGRLYAERLAGAGIATEHRDYAGLVHGFFSLTGVLDAAADAQALATTALRAAFDARS